MSSAKPYNLFLDDERDPHHVTWGPEPELYIDRKWVIVRDYVSFCGHILEHGLPHLVSFDHDLAEEHYAPHEVQKEFDSWEEWQNSRRFVEPTGLDCAKWLVKYCRELDRQFPWFLVHSKNPVGTANIFAEVRAYMLERRRMKNGSI